MNKLRKVWWVGAVVVGVLVLLPVGAMAAGAPDAFAVFQEAIQGLIDLTRDAYCAAGIVAFCP